MNKTIKSQFLYRSRQRSAFTVLELLIALALVVVVFTLVGGILKQTIRTSKREISRTTRTMAARLILEQVASDVQSSFPLRDPAGNVLFESRDGSSEFGPADSVSLIRPAQEAVLPTVLEKVVYRIRSEETPGDGQQVLIVARGGIQSVTRMAEMREKAIGLPGAESQVALELEFLARQEGQPVWRKQWMDEVRLPEAVKVRVSVGDNLPETEGLPPVELEEVIYVHSARVGEATS